MKKKDNIKFIKEKGLIVLLLFSFLECVFFYDTANILGCFVSIYGWLLLTHCVLSLDNLRKFLLPTLAVSGYIISYYFLPLIVTLIEFKPITFNFEVPYLTFFNNFINVTVMVLAFNFAKRFYSKSNILTRFWHKIGYFRCFTEREIWIIGFIGLFCWTYYALFILKYNQSYDEIYEGAEGGFVSEFLKIVGGYAPFPIVLLNSKIAGVTPKTDKKYIYLYLLIFISVTIVSGRRGAMLFPFLSFALLLVINAILNRRFLFKGRKTSVIIIMFLVISGPVSDLVFAMALNRYSDQNMFKGIWETVSDREKLAEMKSLALVAIDNSSGWSEYYVDNIIMDRFCNLRVQDATLYYANELGFDDSGMKKYVSQFLVNEVPSFIIRAFHVKKELVTSPADYITSRYFGDDWYALGSKVSGDTGTGLFWLGYWYYAVAFILYSFFFYFIGSFANGENGVVGIPLHIKGLIFTYFTTFINGMGIMLCIHVLVRGGFQQVLIFCGVSFVARYLGQRLDVN